MKIQPVKCIEMKLNRDRATKLHVTELADLSNTWSETPKTDFLATRLNKFPT